MSTAAPDLFAELAAVIKARQDLLRQAKTVEARVMELVNRMRQDGLDWRAIAARLAKADGRLLSEPERRRHAARLRQHFRRVTRRHAIRPGTDDGVSFPPVDSGEQQRSEHMPLVKRTVTTTTEEFEPSETDDLAGLDDAANDDDEQDEQDEQDERAECADEKKRRR